MRPRGISPLAPCSATAESCSLRWLKKKKKSVIDMGAPPNRDAWENSIGNAGSECHSGEEHGASKCIIEEFSASDGERLMYY